MSSERETASGSWQDSLLETISEGGELELSASEMALIADAIQDPAESATSQETPWSPRVRADTVEIQTDIIDPPPQLLNPPSSEATQNLFGYTVTGTAKFRGPVCEYEGFDPFDQTPIRLRLLRTSDIRDDRRTIKQWVQLFEREGVIAAALSHPGIPRLLNAGIEGNDRFLIYEKNDGEPLRNALTKGALEDTQSIRRIIRDLAEAIQHMHDKGVVHCQVRFDQVMLTGAGTAYLSHLDFAAPTAGPHHPDLAHSTAVPPEFLTKKMYTPAGDQFGLGTILFEVLTGTHPFRGGSRREVWNRIVTQAAPPVEKFRPDAEPTLQEMAERLLRIDPEARFKSCGVVARRLSRLSAIKRRRARR